jgi:hypothetical protein
MVEGTPVRGGLGEENFWREKWSWRMASGITLFSFFR